MKFYTRSVSELLHSVQVGNAVREWTEKGTVKVAVFNFGQRTFR